MQQKSPLEVGQPEERAGPSDARSRGRERAGAAAPGVITSGESSPLVGIPESGESIELRYSKRPGGRVVFHPQPHPDVPGFAALVDYLNCTFPFQTTPDTLREFFMGFLAIVGETFAPIKERGKGFNGYQRSFELGAFGAKFACIGQRGTGFLSLPGQACAAIQDWPALVAFLRDVCKARITRWDGAVDDFEGKHSVDWAVERYLAGDFGNGGNKPSCKQHGNWIEPDGTGRTFYIGKRQNGKLLRVYEKGMQCIHEWHPWVRWEVELHNVDRVIPWEAVLDPGSYVAGAYPRALGWVQEEMSRIRTIQKEGSLSYEHLVHCASTAYGPLINVMMDVEGSPEKVIEKLRKPGAPARLRFPTEQKWHE